MTPRSKDIQAFLFDPSPGGTGNQVASDVFEALCALHVRANDWYLAEKRRKALPSKVLRIVSITFLSGGALLPLLAAVYLAISPYWGYVLLALAAGALLIDRHLGYTSAWSRCVSTAMEINHNLLILQVDWFSKVDQEDDIRWEILHRHASQLGRIVTTETAMWVDDMARVVKELENRLTASRGHNSDEC